jgi:hypothetical protein
MVDIKALRRELVSQDADILRKARRADLGWMAVGAGIMAVIIAMRGGVLAVLG